MKRLERKWMYERVDANKKLRLDYVNGVENFVEHAKEQREYQIGRKLRCPCQSCKNTKLQNEFEVRDHLFRKGFTEEYYDWVCHGEEYAVEQEETDTPNTYREMVLDALGHSVLDILEEPPLEETEEIPNPQAKVFFDMLDTATKPLYEGTTFSLLKAVSRIVNLKCENNITHRGADGVSSLLWEALPENNIMTRSFYTTKKVLKGLELPHQKIHSCPSGCMLFWKLDHALDKCKKCNEDRYKLTSTGKQVPKKVLTYFPIAPRLQRLYATKKIAGHMRWHSENKRVPGTMAHPSDGEAWKHFDTSYPEFAEESRNVRLGLCTDGFSPFGQFGRSYSCWPVILTPYNLPPWLCLKRPFMFLTLIVPGPKNPKGHLDVYLQPLVDELKMLWEVGVLTYDVSKKQNFQMRASLMWTINDFPAYAMVSGWSTAGYFACPYCMDSKKSFHLPHGNKICWFDCHRQFLPMDHVFRGMKTTFLKDRVVFDTSPPRLSGNELWEQVKHFPTVVNGTSEEFKRLKRLETGWFKQSILWELPYWKTLLIRHNLDVMHIEKNFFEQLIYTVMDVKDKTVDGPNSRKDLRKFCQRPSLYIRKSGEIPKAPYTLDKAQKKVLCEWISNLKFPDGYASDLSRCVDLDGLRLHGLKSHDCHVFMERLLPVALKSFLPVNIWNAITEISQFFRDLCASTIKLEDMIRLKNNIAEIICKLEKIFPPSFFNSMEHLPVHLPYEAKVGGPVQYRWMYPFERFLNHLKKKIKNKARVEGSICNAYLTEEISNFCSLYFEDHVDTKANDLDLSLDKDNDDSNLPEVFQDHLGSTSGKCRKRYLDEKEYQRAHIYVLSNCEILREHELEFEKFINQQHPQFCPDGIWSEFEEQFPKWFKEQVMAGSNDDLLQALAMGPSREVKCWKRYSINGYNFHTFDYGKSKASMNYGVGISSIEGNQFYGILDEIIELTYCGDKSCYTAILFKCDWMDNSSRGMNVHAQYKLVEVNYTRRYLKYDPFVLAYQVQQVYFAPYPSTKNDRNQWRAVFKTKARSHIDAPIQTIVFQEEVVVDHPVLSLVDDKEDDVDVEDEELEEDEQIEVSVNANEWEEEQEQDDEDEVEVRVEGIEVEDTDDEDEFSEDKDEDKDDDKDEDLDDSGEDY